MKKITICLLTISVFTFLACGGGDDEPNITCEISLTPGGMVEGTLQALPMGVSSADPTTMNRRFAQSFTVSAETTVTTARAYLTNDGAIPDSYELYLNICDDDGTGLAPNCEGTTSGASNPLEPADVSRVSGDWTYFTYPEDSSIILVPDTTYWLVLLATDDPGELIWWTGGLSSYTNGAGYIYEGTQDATTGEWTYEWVEFPGGADDSGTERVKDFAFGINCAEAASE